MSKREKATGDRAKELPAAVEPDIAAPTPMPRRPLRVLIVEDEAIIAMELEMLLEEVGAEVVGIAMSAAEAEQIAATHAPDLITMDINLKGARDGVSAAIGIFQSHGIRSVFVSAYGDAGTVARAAPANPIGWIRKPIEKYDLETILRHVEQDG